MAEKFKVFQFVDEDYDPKYAHPLPKCWGQSSMPFLMRNETTVEDLKAIYPELDFDKVKLVTKELI